jgi:ribose 5-phosphate isomerase B
MAPEQIAIASDHAGYELKTLLIQELKKQDYQLLDLGTNNIESVDYPDYAALVVKAIEIGKATKGILICGSGIGMSIAANRHQNIRAALCYNQQASALAREHNDANVLVLGAKMMDTETAFKCVNKFLTTEFSGGRHITRIQKLSGNL